MKITIITITYNSERYLPETIASVFSQDYLDLEYILVDGGSTDGTLDIIRGHAANDSRIRWISEPDQGISDAMNKGVALATGEVIAHLHSDDYYPAPDILSIVAGEFRRSPDAFWLTGGACLVGGHGQLLKKIHVRRYSYSKLVRSNFILHPATFIRRSAFMAAGGFSKSLKYAMDYDLWLRLAKFGAPMAVNRPLACFRVHQGGLSSGEADKTFREEWSIRRTHLAGRPLGCLCHYLYFLMKRVRNRLVAQHLLRERG
jgi:GT2 family glycosyltransferase